MPFFSEFTIGFSPPKRASLCAKTMSPQDAGQGYAVLNEPATEGLQGEIWQSDRALPGTTPHQKAKTTSNIRHNSCDSGGGVCLCLHPQHLKRCRNGELGGKDH